MKINIHIRKDEIVEEALSSHLHPVDFAKKHNPAWEPPTTKDSLEDYLSEYLSEDWEDWLTWGWNDHIEIYVDISDDEFAQYEEDYLDKQQDPHAHWAAVVQYYREKNKDD